MGQFALKFPLFLKTSLFFLNFSHVLSHFRGRVGNKSGFATFGFEHRGSVLVEAGERSLDDITDVAIECEAEDVQETEEEGEKLYEVCVENERGEVI